MASGKKSNKPIYSRNEINAYPQNEEMANNLLDRLVNAEYLSLAERQHICRNLKFLYNDQGDFKLPALGFPTCVDCVFADTYLRYYNNFKGWHKAFITKGVEATPHEKQRDVQFLNSQYLIWKDEVVYNQRISDELLKTVQIESFKQIKQLKKYCQKVGYGYFRFLHLEKGIVLHSKYLFLMILEYYEEGFNKIEEVQISNNKIVIDYYSYVHILFRHYAASIKEHQQDKSYHFSSHFDHKHLPKEILKILILYSSLADNYLFDNEKLFFKYNDKRYAIWWKQMELKVKGHPKETILRVQTLYPVIEPRDLGKIALLDEIIINAELSFFLCKR